MREMPRTRRHENRAQARTSAIRASERERERFVEVAVAINEAENIASINNIDHDDRDIQNECEHRKKRGEEEDASPSRSSQGGRRGS